MNADGDVQCSAEGVGAPNSYGLRMCWCQEGVPWGDDVRKGVASLVRLGMTPRIEIAADEESDPDCTAESDGMWQGCVMMSKRWDTKVVPAALIRAAPAEEQLDMTLRMMDACHHLSPDASLRVLGVRSGTGGEAITMPVSGAKVCSVVFKPEEGPMWTAETSASYCATQPGSCTTTPCECKSSLRKLELHTPQGRKCWACAEAGKEYTFRVNALAEQLGGSSSSWWPPSGINCPPILWMFMDWRQVAQGCPALCGYMVLFVCCLMLRRAEELTGGAVPWTRVAPLFGPPLKRGEVWRFFTFPFFHVQFLELFHNVMTMLDTLDVEGTPSILLGDGSNLKCGVGAKQNPMCYPSIGIGSMHTIGVGVISCMVGGMCWSWISFKSVVTGASALGFGLSGAVVALYGLYAGAELDQTTSSQRSFQDWVYLRLIFVGFHIAMEWIRGISQRDAAGLFGHTASFAAGFTYVLYFLPPMGDGTLLSSDRPYVVPCAYNVHDGEAATGEVPECIRLFSQLYEYEVPVVQTNALLLFIATIAFTVVNVVVIQRKTLSSEAAILAGCEVSAVCCAPRATGAAGQQPAWRASNLEGKQVIFWCEVIDVSGLAVTQAAGDWKPLLQVRILAADPRRVTGGMMDATAESSARTRSVEGSETPEWRESVFLPVTFSKAAFVQLVLSDEASGSETPLGFAALPMSQALRFGARKDYSEQRLRLQAFGDSTTVNVGRGSVHVRFRCLEIDQLRRLRGQVTKEMDEGRRKLEYFEQQMAALQLMQAEVAASEGAGASP